ncbi:MAG: DUF3108 domain-containing protein [Gammaproteobacteria bacterium]|nr:DUF3108 domain-containing protein [Gammaproteobacteria bacterium]
MKTLKKLNVICSLLLLTLISTAPVSAVPQNNIISEQNTAQSNKLIEKQLHWSQLEYQASKFGFSVKSKIKLVSLPTAQSNAMLIKPEPEHAVASISKNNYYMTLHTQLLGRDLQTMVWFDPADVRALQRVHLETGTRKNEYKAYRFTQNGTFMIRKKPKAEEVGLPHENWTNIDREYSRLTHKPPNLFMAEPASLFYIVSVADLTEPGDSIELPMLSRGRLIRVKLTVEKQKTYRTDYTKKQPTEDSEVKKDIEALEISIRARPLNDPNEHYNLKLAGLKGDLHFIIDKEIHIPLELNGNMKILGTVRFKLKHVVVR